MDKAFHIRVVELFAGVGGFRIGLEAASDAYDTVWNNQWEPSTVQQDASLVYRARFGSEGHSNRDINTVETNEIPDHDLRVGGFPCQDYSVASTLSRSGGIEGKKGVLWWQIYRILKEKGNKRPKYVFFENVDRLLGSPAKQRGRDFAIIIASLCDLGYSVEWRVINAADYGLPQRRRRTYIVGYLDVSEVRRRISDPKAWLLYEGVMAKAFPYEMKPCSFSTFSIDGDIPEVSEGFNKGKADSPFGDAGYMWDRHVMTCDAAPEYDGEFLTLGDNLVDEQFVPEEFFISPDDLPRWQYEKGAKKIERTSAEGYKYTFSEGAMAFPDPIDKPSRTIITGEGGPSASRFKHVILTPSGRYRRLMPIELERLNMFPDNHTYHPKVSDGRRAFLMGNALVCGIVEKIGRTLYETIFNIAAVSTHPIDRHRIKEPDILREFYQDIKLPIARRTPKKDVKLDLRKPVLIGFVKPENNEYFLDGERTKLYYTGKTRAFPSTVALNKLYYFMPYIKKQGVRDIYLIRKARIGSKQEVNPDSGDKDPRLVFELEFLCSLPDYKDIRPNLMYTYRDTILARIIDC